MLACAARLLCPHMGQACTWAQNMLLSTLQVPWDYNNCLARTITTQASCKMLSMLSLAVLHQPAPSVRSHNITSTASGNRHDASPGLHHKPPSPSYAPPDRRCTACAGAPNEARRQHACQPEGSGRLLRRGVSHVQLPQERHSGSNHGCSGVGAGP